MASISLAIKKKYAERRANQKGGESDEIRKALHNEPPSRVALFSSPITIWSIAWLINRKLVIHCLRRKLMSLTSCRYSSWSKGKKCYFLSVLMFSDILGTMEECRNSSYRWASGQKSSNKAMFDGSPSKDLSVSTSQICIFNQTWLHG